MFRTCKNEEEAKKLYRELAKRLHPDIGGSNALMTLLTEVYELVLREYKNGSYSAKKEQFHEARNKSQKFETAWEDIQSGDPRLKILQEIFDYSTDHKRFDPSFLISIIEFLDEHHFITSQQYNSLCRIHASFRISEWIKKKHGNDPTK